MVGIAFIFVTIILCCFRINLVVGQSIDLDKCFEVVSRAVDTAGPIISGATFREKVANYKTNEWDIVTETDVEIQKFLMNAIKTEFPDHKFIGEETQLNGSLVLTNNPTWIIDPIDGTMSFYHNFPHSSISIALAVNQTLEIGIIYNPLLKQLFTARRGQGAFYNGNQIHVSNRTNFKKSLFIYDPSWDNKITLAIIKENAHLPCHAIRCLGSIALHLAMVGLGAADISASTTANIWDVAAGVLIVREAGGIVSNIDGDEWGFFTPGIIASSSRNVTLELLSHLNAK